MTLSFSAPRFSFDPSARARAPKQRKPKAFKRGPRFIEMLSRWATDGSWIEIDLPIDVQAQHGYMRTNKIVEANKKKEHLVLFKSQLKRLYSVDRELITDVTFTRFSSSTGTDKEMDSDNLGWAVKHLRDETALWIVTGELECPRHEWGSHDGILKRKHGREIWHCESAKHDTDPRLKGIRIRLQLSSKSAAPTKP